MNGKRLFVNALTFARVPLIFLWAVLAILQEFRGGFWLAFWACAAMLASGLTDAFDGALARKWGVVSTLGKMADPLMDKVFYMVALPVVLWQSVYQNPSDPHTLVILVLTVLYMLRDTWVTFMRSIGTLYGADVAAMWLGKVRTALSFPGIGWVYMFQAFAPLVPTNGSAVGNEGLMVPWYLSCLLVEAVLVVLTLWSMVSYTRQYAPYLKRALERK